MFKFRHIFAPPDVQEERDFEKANVTAKLERYLRTNPLDRFAFDEAYRHKVELTERNLGPIRGLILDIGGNTAGEATILQQRGFRIVVGDINELALDISRQRAEKFGLQKPGYVAFDAKTKLIEHYKTSLGAEQVGRSSRLVIDQTAALHLVEQYFKETDQWPW